MTISRHVMLIIYVLFVSYLHFAPLVPTLIRLSFLVCVIHREIDLLIVSAFFLFIIYVFWLLNWESAFVIVSHVLHSS